MPLTSYMVLHDAAVRVDTDPVALEGRLSVPYHAHGLILFVHGSGSTSSSPRNRAVASELNRAGLATLLFDLLTPEEEAVDRVNREFRFDIPLLARRVTGAIDWAVRDRSTTGLPLGLFGASTGAAAALVAAADRPGGVAAVVSRGGRPDLARAALGSVRCPVLFLVGGDDNAVIDFNQQAMGCMTAPARLHLIPHATHLFEEPGALEEVARLARGFFALHLGGCPSCVHPASLSDLRHMAPDDSPRPDAGGARAL